MIAPGASRLLQDLYRIGLAAQDGFERRLLRRLAQDFAAQEAQVYMPDGAWDLDGPLPFELPRELAGLRLHRVHTGEELRLRRPGSGSRPDSRDQRAVGLRAGARVAWFVLGRNTALQSGAGAFRAVDSAALSGLVPHLEQVLECASDRRAMAQELMSAHLILARLQIGQVSFNAQGALCNQDAVAATLIARPGVHVPRLLPAQDTPRLHACGAGVHLLHLPAGGGPSLGYLRGSDAPLPEAATLAQLFGLTLPEARLVRALGAGTPLAESARMLGFSLETARTYSKQIFAKTGARGQSALMRLLWTSPLILAPGQQAGGRAQAQLAHRVALK